MVFLQARLRETQLGRRVQRILKKARTRAQAIKATTVIENKVFEDRYQIERRPEIRFDKFVKDRFLPYSKLHKRTYPDDVKICDMLNETFGRMMRSGITPPTIEKWKQKRRVGKTMYKRLRNPATVNRELCVLSKIFSLAFDAELIESNPCRRVRKFRTNRGRSRYLLSTRRLSCSSNSKVRNGYRGSLRWLLTPE